MRIDIRVQQTAARRGKARRKRGVWHGLAAALLTLLGGAAHASDTAVPPAWISYAEAVGRQFQMLIEAEDSDNAPTSADAIRFRHYLDARRVRFHGTRTELTIVVAAWIGADGQVTRVEFDSLGDRGADSALRGLLMASLTPGAPPRDMRQPLRVRLRVAPATDEPVDGGAMHRW
jgi:hypothetical protein